VRFWFAAVVPCPNHKRRGDAVWAGKYGHALSAIAEDRQECGLERVGRGSSTRFEGTRIRGELARQSRGSSEQCFGVAAHVIGVRSEGEKRECDDDPDEEEPERERRDRHETSPDPDPHDGYSRINRDC
jgi:hypothetical protein